MIFENEVTLIRVMREWMGVDDEVDVIFRFALCDRTGPHARLGLSEDGGLRLRGELRTLDQSLLSGARLTEGATSCGLNSLQRSERPKHRGQICDFSKLDLDLWGNDSCEMGPQESRVLLGVIDR